MGFYGYGRIDTIRYPPVRAKTVINAYCQDAVVKWSQAVSLLYARRSVHMCKHASPSLAAKVIVLYNMTRLRERRTILGGMTTGCCPCWTSSRALASVHQHTQAIALLIDHPIQLQGVSVSL